MDIGDSPSSPLAVYVAVNTTSPIMNGSENHHSFLTPKTNRQWPARALLVDERLRREYL